MLRESCDYPTRFLSVDDSSGVFLILDKVRMHCAVNLQKIEPRKFQHEHDCPCTAGYGLWLVRTHSYRSTRDKYIATSPKELILLMRSFARNYFSDSGAP